VVAEAVVARVATRATAAIRRIAAAVLGRRHEVLDLTVLSLLHPVCGG
jgi:hypothetical protein